MTPFRFEHVFVAPAPADVFAAYFDSQLQGVQDRALAIAQREVIELIDRGDQICRRSRIVPSRRLPLLVRAFSSEALHYTEHVVGSRATNQIAIELRLLGGRGRVTGNYLLEPRGQGSVLRSYSGTVSVDVAVIAARIERGIVAEFERSLVTAAACTQSWLDGKTHPSVAART
jgi:hypothetical protein